MESGACRRAAFRPDANTQPDVKMEFTLDNNFSTFDGKNFLQTEGTTIGSKLGRNNAFIYLEAWEENLLNASGHKPIVFFRYIDKIFDTWDKGITELKKFHETANEIHENITVDLRTSKFNIDFLDINVKLNDGHELTTDLHEKETNWYTKLHKT